MLKYNVGDIVQVVKHNNTEYELGDLTTKQVVGVVKELYNDTRYLVKVEGYSGIYDYVYFKFGDEHLTLISSENTNLKDVESEMYNPLTVQQSGEHYSKRGIQPVEYGMANNLSFPQVNIVKYVTRHEDKNGIDDLAKSIHYHFFEALRVYGEEGSTELRDKVLKLLNKGN